MAKTRALYISTMWPPYGQGGEEQTNYENYNILKDIFNFQILTTSPETSPSFVSNDRIEADDKFVNRLLKPGHTDDSGYNVKVLNGILKKHNPEFLLIGHPYGFGQALVDELKNIVCKKVFFIGDITIYQDNANGIFLDDYFKNEFCIFVSDFTRLCLEAGWHPQVRETRKFVFDKNKCFTLYPSIEPQTEYADLTDFNLCSLGRFDHVKGFHMLINSSNKYNFNNILTLYGDGVNFKKFSEYANCPGWLNSEDKYDTLRKHSVFIFASDRYETFGLTWLEAASVGLPLVISNLNVMHEVIPPGLAVMFKSGDIDDLARAVFELQDKEARDIYQKKSLELASIYSDIHKRRCLLETMQKILCHVDS